jgi:hypothetical protein
MLSHKYSLILMIGLKYYRNATGKQAQPEVPTVYLPLSAPALRGLLRYGGGYKKPIW